MADVKVRKLEDRVVEFHRRKAEKSGHSLEAELRKVITEAASHDRQKWALEVHRRLERLRRKYGIMPDSTPGIRAERERRG
jgi:plasmid stability protein